MVEYDPEGWQRIPEYGRFMQEKGDSLETTFAPLFLSFLFLVRGGEKILDVACGAGTMAYLLELEKVPVKYTGFDITPCYLDMARERFPQHTWVEGDVREMPFEDQQFDYTFCVNLLQHLTPSDMSKAVREMARVTKKMIFLQAEFQPTTKEGTVKSTFAEVDGTIRDFLFNSTGCDILQVPGWEAYTLADYDKLVFMISARVGREHQYVVMERKA